MQRQESDIVKTVYTGDVETFRRVIKTCPVPIVIAGGPKANTNEEIIEMCVGAMKAGAKGVTFGRNVFQHQNPPAIVNALYKLIVKGISRKEVLRESAKHKEERSYN